jgi:predicted hydrocarbon binding protein
MHGIIFAELQKFVDAKLGRGSWAKVLKQAGYDSKIYLPVQEYPDEEAVALAATAAKIAGLDIQDVLQGFGEFIVPDLVKMYAAVIKADWKTLDVVEHTEETIHRVVRIKNRGAKPPEIRCVRPSKSEVVITYSSARKMCSLAKGIVSGLAKHYKEKIAISETKCMLKGGAHCEITLRKAGS